MCATSNACVRVDRGLTPQHVQEFNIEKLQYLEKERNKIKKEYERREGQIDVKKKMCDTQCT